MHRRILLDSTVTQGDFALKLDAYRLGPLKHSDTETRIWFQMSAKKHAQLPDAGAWSGEEPVIPLATSSPASKKHLDILVELKMAQLLDIVQKDDGYYCTVAIRAESKPAVDALITAAEYHLAANVVGAEALRLETPFLGATEDNLAGGIVERMLCKINVFAGRMTATSIYSKENKRVFGPGDSAAQLCEMPPFGFCNASIRLMGFWHNERAFGPVIYLSTAQLTSPALPRKILPATHTLFAPTDMSSLNPLHRRSLTETPKTPRPPRSISARSSQLFGLDDEYSADSEEFSLSPVTSRASDCWRTPSCPSIRSSQGMASFMSQASTAEIFDSDEEEVETDRGITPPIQSPKKTVDTTWVTCGPRANDDWAKPIKCKTPAFIRSVQLPGDKALRAHPNPIVRSLFKD